MVDRHATRSPSEMIWCTSKWRSGKAGAKRGHDLLQVRREARAQRFLVIDAAGGDGSVGVVDLAAVEHPLEAFAA